MNRDYYLEATYADGHATESAFYASQREAKRRGRELVREHASATVRIYSVPRGASMFLNGRAFVCAFKGARASDR